MKNAPRVASRLNSVVTAFLTLLIAAGAAHRIEAAGSPRKLSLTPRWETFERSFTSSIDYSNPIQETALTVTFTSPQGAEDTVDAFWDGDRTWRVRYAPNQAGVWTYRTECSDQANSGLHNKMGQFLCTAPTAKTRLSTHGPVSVMQDGRHFEHADGTPFFWLSDAVWHGAVFSRPAEWQTYTKTRSHQGFNAVLFHALPWEDSPVEIPKEQAPFSGRDRIQVHPDYFQRLDAKIETLGRAGLVSAPVLAWSMDTLNPSPLDALPDDQVILLLRYMVARWGAHHTAWVIGCEADSLGLKIDRWKGIGRQVFGASSRSPVILHTGETDWLRDEFRSESWVSAFGYQGGRGFSEDAIQLLVAGPLLREWRKQPPRPVINLAPPAENSLLPGSDVRVDPTRVRQTLFWSLLSAPPTGMGYSANGVWNWETYTEYVTDPALPALPVWQKSMYLPGGRQVKHLAAFFNGIDFSRLRPAPHLVLNQPGAKDPRRFVSLAMTEERDLTVVYVPEDRTIELHLLALPRSPTVTWFNPRSGETSPAVAVVSGHSCQFPTPEPGDWVLLMKSSQR